MAIVFQPGRVGCGARGVLDAVRAGGRLCRGFLDDIHLAFQWQDVLVGVSMQAKLVGLGISRQGEILLFVGRQIGMPQRLFAIGQLDGFHAFDQRREFELERAA
ncbi:hypothetical protein D3C85_1699910 [compost metagenome]